MIICDIGNLQESSGLYLKIIKFIMDPRRQNVVPNVLNCHIVIHFKIVMKTLITISLKIRSEQSTMDFSLPLVDP